MSKKRIILAIDLDINKEEDCLEIRGKINNFIMSIKECKGFTWLDKKDGEKDWCNDSLNCCPCHCKYKHHELED